MTPTTQPPIPTTEETTETPTTQETTETPTPTTQETTETPTTQETTETPKTMEPTETTTISTGSPSANNRTTCDVLAELAKNSEPFDCVASTKEPCDQVDCATEFAGLKFNAEVVLLPCNTPPAVHITMSRDGKVVVNKTVDHSQEIVITELFGVKLNVTLDHFQQAMGLQVEE